MKYSRNYVFVRGNINIGIFLAFTLCCSLSNQAFPQDCDRKQLNNAVMVDTLFAGFLQEKFFNPEGPHEESGWMMELPSGKMVIRSFLMTQADTIISFGVEIVPSLFKWVMNDHLFIRYIAVYSLEQLTGIQSGIPNFDSEDQSGNRQKAIQKWNDWWMNRNERK